MLVVGIGNAQRGDDAAGLLVARALRHRLPEGWRLLELEGEGTSLLEAWAGEEAAIVVDAMRSGQPVGTVLCFEAHERPLPSEAFRVSSHLFGLAEAIELGRALDMLPRSLTVFGIEGGDCALGRPPGPEVMSGVERCVEMVLDRVRRPVGAD